MDETDARRRIERITAKVLANRKPPYGLRGGLYDALTDTDGTTGVVDNETAAAAAALFERVEGIDLAPAAAVAVAHLIAAARAGIVKRDDAVMLNVTGGGYRRIQVDRDVREVQPTRVIQREDFTPESVASVAAELF
jgi:cysteate synthase